MKNGCYRISGNCRSDVLLENLLLEQINRPAGTSRRWFAACYCRNALNLLVSEAFGLAGPCKIEEGALKAAFFVPFDNVVYRIGAKTEASSNGNGILAFSALKEHISASKRPSCIDAAANKVEQMLTLLVGEMERRWKYHDAIFYPLRCDQTPKKHDLTRPKSELPGKLT